VNTYLELRDQAATEFRAHFQASSSDSARHFVVDRTNYFVEHGAVPVAALRLWAQSRHKTDDDLRKLIASANAAALDDIAEQLAQSGSPDELLASVQLEGVAYAPPRQLYDLLEFARKGLQPS
jgi:hypothetical protein